MDNFEIKFYVLNHDLEEMKEMSLKELEYEFSSIYGQFTFTIGKYEYLLFLEPDVMPEEIMSIALLFSRNSTVENSLF